MTPYPGIAPPLDSHDCLIALVHSLGTLWETALSGVLLSLSMILVCRWQDCPRQRPLAVWTFFIRPQTYLPPRRRPWAWHEMGWGCQILWAHNNHYKKKKKKKKIKNEFGFHTKILTIDTIKITSFILSSHLLLLLLLFFFFTFMCEKGVTSA